MSKYGTKKRNPWGRKPKVISQEQVEKLQFTSLVFPKDVVESKAAKNLLAGINGPLKQWNDVVGKLIDTLLPLSEEGNKEANKSCKDVMARVIADFDIVAALTDVAVQNKAYLDIMGISLEIEEEIPADNSKEVVFG